MCQSCQRRGILCEGYVLRWTGVAARGRFAGKTIPLENPSGTVSNESGPLKGVDHGYFTSTDRLAKAPVIQKFGSAGDIEEELIQYYAHELSSVFYLGATPTESPYLLHVIPLTREVLPLRYAVAASAACHLAARRRDDVLETQSRELRLKAVSLLRSRLGDKKLSTDFGTLASIVMMVQLDLCSGDCVEFDTHVPAAKALVEQHGADKTSRKFFEQRLAWLDILRSTTSSRFPTFSSAEIKSTIDQFRSDQGREWGCDVFPCPIDLFEYVADITMLYKLQYTSADTPSANTVRQATRLGQQVRNWRPSTAYSPLTAHVVNAWQSGIILYVMRLFRLPTDDIFDVECLKSAIFGYANSVPTASRWGFSMLWPLFQAGLYMNDEQIEQREWLRQRLEMMFRAVGCRQFGIALDTLNFVWDSHEYYNSITAGELKGPLMLS
ncbi:hypothetical protein PV08_07346 [Exophiala spinifera]|uniref:Zn(2)-C6 fungal-type domain-containing protein n=1 Tax=Exophiala spinifera TaxID=91928 RepID=A0A0D1ZP44_9EURO|nr:uncharacterized protein PV08_07346 [Exophiala spinifera]KIW14562.1 hypothetical protein PV08_07346 [Exophiala spinifera]